MWQLYQKNYDGVKKEKFISDLAEKDYVFCGFDRVNPSKLGGFTTSKIYSIRVDGKRNWVYFSGDTMFRKAYWGQKALHRSVGNYLLEHKLKYPKEPFYWFLVVMGYRTYLTMARNTPNYWPRHDSSTPPEIQRIIDVLAKDRFGLNFQPGQGLIKPHPGSGSLGRHVTPITRELVDQVPEIAFFVRNNPNYQYGFEMACLGKLDFSFFMNVWSKYLRKKAKSFIREFNLP
ncbi:hypothetical protein [Robiginitalea sp. SC105]|uniref:hypothetical protein n=1 Tax=Robiginitalea sp. SC105 TaxID=2762332 RepID=UPI00163B3F8F|nr:hypothetical protein [Robiginitalea sp. SC105]MBC2840067.1 hypothetical protein [Robiginitalea sp. SC105]